MRTRTITLMGMLAATVLSCGDATGSHDVCLGENDTPLPIAPRSARVDLGRPTFASPTNVTNPLFPISALSRVILLGSAGGVPLRVETTLMPATRTIEWNGQDVETLVSQYVAFLDGQIHEVALDWYAQADDGSVWYFGEDVFNYENGVVLETDGTWLAGRDGPAAMIMPANPQVAQVWRPENVCGVVFEEVTALATGVTVTGPQGPVPGALVVRELHMDGTTEDKTFAPGYGEFSTGAGSDLEAVALAVPTDFLTGPTPAELVTLLTGANEIFDQAQVQDWPAAATEIGSMTSAWTTFQAGPVPPMLEAQMETALSALDAAVTAQSSAAVRQAAVAVARATLDLQLRHRPRGEIDLALLDNWARQLLVSAAAGDQPGVLGAAATVKWIRERLTQDAIYEPDLSILDARLADLRVAAATRDLPAAAAAAAGLVRALGGMR